MSGPLASGWDREAASWIEFARERDDFAWRFNLPLFLELVPSPGRLTLDIGCGEGRVARELAARGHRVIGIERSARLVQAARTSDPPVEVIEADARNVPLDDGAADVAVAFMSLQSIDDLDAAVAEAGRLLEPGGRLCVAIVHPMNSLGDLLERDPEASYFEQRPYEAQGAEVTFHDAHRPLEAYFRALERAGFAVEKLREPAPGADLIERRPRAVRWTRQPCFLHLRAVRS